MGGQGGKIYQSLKHKASDLASPFQLYKDIRTRVFTEALFVIEKHRTQPKQISIGAELGYDTFIQWNTMVLLKLVCADNKKIREKLRCKGV